MEKKERISFFSFCYKKYEYTRSYHSTNSNKKCKRTRDTIPKDFTSFISIGVSNEKKRKGIALIVVISFCVVISVIGITFIRSSTLEKITSSNYIAKVDAKLAAYAGFDNAVARITQHIMEGKLLYTPATDDAAETIPIIYPAAPGTDSDLDTACINKDLLSFGIWDKVHSKVASVNGNYSYSGLVGRESSGNIIGRYEISGNSYALKIENSARKFNINSHIANDTSNQLRSNIIKNGILKTLAIECSLDTSSNPTLSETNAQTIADALCPKNANIIRYENIYEVEEILAGKPFPNEKIKQKFLSNICTNSWLNEKTYGVFQSAARTLQQPPQYYKEARSPVDINGVSVELLSALIANIKANPCFYRSREDNEVKHSSTFFGNTDYPDEITMAYEAVQVPIDFSKGNYRELAQRLLYVDYPTNSVRRTYRDRGSFSNTLEALKSLFLSGGYPSIPTSPTDYSWIGTENWGQACTDALRSNFNPNVIDNYWNPNLPLYRRACKGDLFVNGTQCTPSHTTEICFFSGDNIEITSIGRITAFNGTQTIASTKIYGVVELGNIITQTTQQEFRNGTGTNITTFPANPKRTADIFGGGVEPKPINNGTASANYYSGDSTPVVPFGIFADTPLVLLLKNEVMAALYHSPLLQSLLLAVKETQPMAITWLMMVLFQEQSNIPPIEKIPNIMLFLPLKMQHLRPVLMEQVVKIFAM